jgi:outer membrane protein TolC
MEIQYDVVRYYYSALLSRKVYEIGNEALERLEATLKLIESMYQNGSGKVTKLDYLKNKVMVDQVRTIVTEMKKNVSLPMDALAFTLGTGYEFALPDEEIPFDQQKVELADLGHENYMNNPDLAKLNSVRELYQAKADEAYSGYLPKILLSGSVAQNINSYKSGISNKYNAQMWTISLGAEIPVFDGFRTANEVDEAKVLLRKTEEERSLLKDAIMLQVKEALKRIEVSEENVSNTRQASFSANESRTLFEKAFKQDMAEAKDLVEAQIMESLMAVQYQKALYDHIEAVAYLDFITGKARIPFTKPMVSN